VCAIELVATLTRQAEAARKKEKRSAYSPIYKYVGLVKDWTAYPCLVDASGVVLSFAPFTNSDHSKVRLLRCAAYT
jgi:hypothetical protein